MIRIAVVFVISLVSFTSALTADQPKETPISLERKLHGNWRGPACGGVWRFSPDGSFEATHYSPGNNKLTGTWEVEWNALPPTLVYTVKTSDSPDRIKIGEKTKIRLIQLDEHVLSWQPVDEYPRGHLIRCERIQTELQ